MILVDNRNTSDPYINLALEEYLVRNADCSKGDYLLLYVNEPCLVMGKNQCIYKEVNFEYLRNQQLKLCRRITGGGTVYHDLGNLSFSFISKFEEHKLNNFQHFNAPIVNALIKAGIPAEMDKRNNILCNWKKISGSAQFSDRKNIISHGTLLLNADMKALHASLKSNRFRVETKAVKSVSSSVMNIKEVSNAFNSVEDLSNFLKAELGVQDIYRLSEKDWQEIYKMADEKFRTYEWIYGRSPKAIIRKPLFEITVEDGQISEISGPGRLTEKLIGRRYEYNTVKEAFKGNADSDEILAAVF